MKLPSGVAALTLLLILCLAPVPASAWLASVFESLRSKLVPSPPLLIKDSATPKPSGTPPPRKPSRWKRRSIPRPKIRKKSPQEIEEEKGRQLRENLREAAKRFERALIEAERHDPTVFRPVFFNHSALLLSVLWRRLSERGAASWRRFKGTFRNKAVSVAASAREAIGKGACRAKSPMRGHLTDTVRGSTKTVYEVTFERISVYLWEIRPGLPSKVASISPQDVVGSVWDAIEDRPKNSMDTYVESYVGDVFGRVRRYFFRYV